MRQQQCCCYFENMLGDRLAASRKRAGLTQLQLAMAMGSRYDQTMISHVETNRRGFVIEGLSRASAVLDSSVDYLLGLTDDPTPASRLTDRVSELEDRMAVASPIGLSVRHVEIVEVAAAAGAGMHIEDAPVKGTLAFRREWLDSNSINPGECSVIGVAGESMEPTLVDGSSILVDRSQYRRRRREGRIFVIGAEDGLIVKRAAKDSEGDWFIESDHPEWDPQPWPDNAEVVGEVRWVARTL